MLRAFWQVEYAKYKALPCHLQGTEIGRLEAVFSKLQVWDRFHGRYKRILMVNPDMMVRRNLDEVWSFQDPAGVIGGATDTSLYSKRPIHTYFQRDVVDTGPEIRGGINGGLVLLEPNRETYENMRKKLRTWWTETKVDQQAFISWFFAGDFRALHKKYDFQIHRLAMTGISHPR